MRLDVTRSGGFAGLSTRASLDTAELAGEEAGSLREQVDELDLDDLARRYPTRGPGADRFQYDLTVAGDGQTRTISVAEGEIPDSVRRLIEHVLTAGRPSP